MKFKLLQEKIKRTYSVKNIGNRPVLGFSDEKDGFIELEVVELDSGSLPDNFNYKGVEYLVKEFRPIDIVANTVPTIVAVKRAEDKDYQNYFIEEVDENKAKSKFESEDKKFKIKRIDESEDLKEFYEIFKIDKTIPPSRVKQIIINFLR